jgi:hypothetical protein
MENNWLHPEDRDSSPPPETKQQRPSVYWSVLHHKDVEDTGQAHYHHTAPRHNVDEREPLIHRPEASYGLSSSSAAPHANDCKTISPGWERIREMVQTRELLIHHIPDLDDNTPNDSKRTKSPFMMLSDLNEYSFEYSLRECFILTLFLLIIGVVGFSLLVEGWSVLDSLYFTVIYLTTIGYGDLRPSTPVGKIFASIFALGGIVVLGLALGVVGSQLVEAEIRYAEMVKEKTSKAIEKSFTHRRVERMTSSVSSSSLSSLDSSGSVTSHNGENNELLAALLSVQQSEGSFGMKVKSYAKNVGHKCWSTIRRIVKLLPGVIPVFSGALIIAYLEGWAWYDAFYYTVVTATTIGLGDLTPTSELSKACAVIFIPFAVAAMGYILGQCATFLVELRREEHHKKLWTCSLKLEDIQALDKDQDGGVNELEYIKYMLVTMKKVDAHLFDELHDQFKQLDVTNDGVVTKNDLQLIAARRLRKVSYKLQLSDYKHKLRKQSRQSIMHSALHLMSSSRRLSAAKRKSTDTQSYNTRIT